MENDIKTAGRVLREKEEERGWDGTSENITDRGNNIIPLPISYEEYFNLRMPLAILALKDQNLKIIELYFDLQRRAIYGNRYPCTSDEILEKLEKEMWDIGQNLEEPILPRK